MKQIYEIHDDNGVIKSGEYYELIHIWNANYLADWAFEKYYGHLNRNPDFLIREWYGKLRLFCLIDENMSGPGKHINNHVKD
ncbi:MAG: hypothetical protein JWO09_881 [Bacteroidetes bacterium]|nr:hypothetical protein [Bacteroidota bacterium]